MNILIKLTCLVGLVIAPILGDGHGNDDAAHAGACASKKECCEKKSSCSSKKDACHAKYGEIEGMKCDMSKCAEMTKEECRKACEEQGCSEEAIEMCMKHYDENGKFIGGHGCKDKSKCEGEKEACKH